MAMTKEQYLCLMEYPKEWSELGMVVDEVMRNQLALAEAEGAGGWEHYRNGAFHWWIRQSPSKDQLRKLLLASLDPDPAVGWDVHRHLRRCEHFDDDLRAYGAELFSGKPSYD